MNKKQFPQLWLVRIDFDDHCQGSGNLDVIKCTAYGLLYLETKEYYCICNWVCDGALNGDDSEGLAIRKHPGIKLTKIKKQSI